MLLRFIELLFYLCAELLDHLVPALFQAQSKSHLLEARGALVRLLCLDQGRNGIGYTEGHGLCLFVIIHLKLGRLCLRNCTNGTLDAQTSEIEHRWRS